MAKGKVRTVLGDIEALEMGFTMAHEHILTNPQGEGTKNNLDHHLDSVPLAIQMLREFKEIGGGAIIETTPESWGRNTPGMVTASQESGVHVVACTGYICEEHGMEPELNEWSTNYVAERMLGDVQVGMDGTTVKAGWIKAGTAYNHITPNEEKVLRAGARAATEAGTCFHTHTTAGTMGIEQCEIVLDEGFDMSKFIVAHVDRVPDLWYHRQILKTGANIIYDGPGKAKYYPDSMRIELLKQLVADGYEDQIMLSNDMGRRSHHKVYGYGPGFNWIKERFLPRLLDEGFSQEVLDKFMIHNPARVYQMEK
ncbi:phosphotriesterase family protein [Oceanobacillus polygoni]|uniref:Phosphotriesterase-related protein n=1 Tax=Oceanobacillus polygoni TaxID=1235259 RepID=A0A9X1CKJ5_9BACI|nr:phosphotriesterase-related protein [Oceanobacillus polygoni]MBP2079437.1 phosphotriesterase-related protein [Oceanobacillus polygoni]